MVILVIKKRVGAMHKCSKEPDLNAMKNKIDISHDAIIGIQTDIAYLRKAVEGNGKPGLVDDVREMKSYTTGLKAQIAMWKYLVGGGVIFSICSLAVTIITVLG